MAMAKILALPTLLTFGASQLALAEASNLYAGGAGEGTESGHPEKAQNQNRGLDFSTFHYRKQRS